MSSDTAEFAIESIRRWWRLDGRRLYRDARRLLICADSGGSHGPKLRAWKLGLQISPTRLRMYEKCSTFLRLEVLSNRLTDFGLGKSLDNLDAVRQTLAAVTDRFATFEATALNVHIDFPLFQRLALPILAGHTKVPGIKIHDTRMVRLMEALLHSGTQIHGWRTAQLHHAVLAAFTLTPTTYTLTQLRYDLRKMKAHDLIERDGARYAYRLTDKGRKVALLFVLFHQRVCGPLANSLFNHPPDPESPPATPLEMAYRKADKSIQQVLELLAA